jgi:predicted ribosomally synthesized peptide with SipW-like signal peptide
MNKKIILSVFIIVMVIAASLGATYAWFTDQSAPVENVFTAGTVILDADEEWEFGEEGLKNWNPGDCTPKLIKLKYEGSKKAFIRMQITETWVDADEQEMEDSPWFDRDVPNIEWKINTGTEEEPVWEDWNVDGKWLYYDGWWYYNGDDDTYSTEIGDEGEEFTINSISGVEDLEDAEEIIIVARVCLDGPETGNDYQGATYTLKVLFQAIQASHNDVWEWDEIDFETGLVESE